MNLLHRVSLAVMPSILLPLVLLTLLLSACFSPEPAPTTAPANFAVTEGDGLVVVDWDPVPGRAYWIFYKEGTSTSIDDFDRIVMNVSPPYVLAGLVNGAQYAFSVTSSENGSKVGPFSPIITAVPRLLGPTVAWTVGTPLTTENLHSIAFGNNIYVTVGDLASIFVATYDYPSEGGVTAWNPPASQPSGTANYSSVRYDGRRFVALSDDGSVIKSTDATAQNWVAATGIPSPPGAMNALTVGAGKYVAVGAGGAIYTNNTDGVTAAWTAQISGTANALYGVAYLNGKFIAVGANGSLLTSSDGVSWSVQTSGASVSLRGLAYGGGTYVAVGDAGVVVSSSDAASWSAQSIFTGESFYSICYGPDAQFVAVGTTGQLAYSSTGADGSWAAASNAGSLDLYAITPNLLFIATGAAGTNVSGK